MNAKVLPFPKRLSEGLDYFELFTGIARAHAIAMVPNFEERERLALARNEHRSAAARKREESRLALEEAFECDETAKRIDEQLRAIK